MKTIFIPAFFLMTSLSGCQRGSDGYLLVEAGDRDKSTPCVSVSRQEEGWVDSEILRNFGCSTASLIDIGGATEDEVSSWSDTLLSGQHRTVGAFSLIEIDSGNIARSALIETDDAVGLVNGLRKNHPSRVTEIDGFLRGASVR